MDERYERVPYRFGRFRLGGHPGAVVGERGDSLLVVPMTTERKRSSKQSNTRFFQNPDCYSTTENYWERRVVEVRKKDFYDYSNWVLSTQDKEKIDGFLKGNSKAKLFFR